MNELLEKFDYWLKDGSEIAAITMRRRLESVEGKDGIIFPPTYPIENNKAGYNIDELNEKSNICQIDSVGSQANRMEPIFMHAPYSNLVPNVSIKAMVDGKERSVNILEAGHRAADAIIRFSTLGPKIHEAFQTIKNIGDASLLAKIAPTSLVFGVWDSQSTQIKLPRILRSVIRAYNVCELKRSAQYTTIAGEILEGPDVEITTKGTKAELGLAHVPAVRTHGGVLVQGEIRQEASLNLVAVRTLAAAPDRDDDTLKLRRYILGLALVCLTAPQEMSLREGCQLIPDETFVAEWKLVKHNGKRETISLLHKDVLDYATLAANTYGVEKNILGEFDSKLANQVRNLQEKDRKALLRQGPVTNETIKKFKKS